MDLECSQILLCASDLARAREFYIGALEFPIVEEHPTMFAFRAGSVRFTVFGGGKKKSDFDDEDVTIMLRTNDLETTVRDLKAKGVVFDIDGISLAPGFMKHIELRDPDNNTLYIAEYLRDPLAPV